MAERKTFEQLDDALEALMANPDRPAPSIDPRLAALLEIAADLRDLPSDAFKDRLRAELLSHAGRVHARPAAADYGAVLLTVDDYLARLDQLGTQASLAVFDLGTAFDGLPERGVRFLTPLNECVIGVSRFSGLPHWECHPDGDELLHILDGEAEIVTVTDDGPVRSTVRAGSIFICPQALWHRVRPLSGSLSMLFATPSRGTEASDTEEPPRTRPQIPADAGATRPPAPQLAVHDLNAALRDLPELAISTDTTAEEADAAFRPLTALGPCTLGVMRYSGLTPWERHPGGDELLHVLEGAIDVTVLTDHGPAQVSVDAGSVFVCPRGLWHRQLPRPSATVLFGTPTQTTEVSSADDPRAG